MSSQDTTRYGEWLLLPLTHSHISRAVYISWPDYFCADLMGLRVFIVAFLECDIPALVCSCCLQRRPPRSHMSASISRAHSKQDRPGRTAWSGAQRCTATVTSQNTLTVNMRFKSGKQWHCLGTACLVLFSSFWPTTSRASQTSLQVPLRSLSDCIDGREMKKRVLPQHINFEMQMYCSFKAHGKLPVVSFKDLKWVSC